MNVLLTSRCNRRCPYCFAQERISFTSGGTTRRQAPEFISEPDFRAAVAFARRSGLRVLGVLGGEPSIHPGFVQLLRHAWDEGLHTKVFSNGLWPEEAIAAVERLGPADREKLHVVLNMNGPRRSPAREHAAQEAFLARLGAMVSLSFNISRLDFDPLFLVDAILDHGARPSIRLGVAEPLAQMENEHVPVAEYPRLAPILLRLAEACDANDIHLGFDCGFTLCMFDAGELGRLTQAGARFRASCGPAVDVGTDLSTWSCFPLSTFCEGRRLGEFPDLESLVAHFRAELKPLYQAGALPACAGCRHRRRGACSGGCAAHVYRSLNP